MEKEWITIAETVNEGIYASIAISTQWPIIRFRQKVGGRIMYRNVFHVIGLTTEDKKIETAIRRIK